MQCYAVDIVIFDCDSTLSAVEGIDELARRAGVFDELAPLTTAAMEGRIKLDEIYRRRLDAIRPNRADIEWLAQQYLENIVPGADTVVNNLQLAGKKVHVVSGGIRQAVLPLAAHLRIPENHVHAVDVHFTSGGDYAGYEETSPLSRSGGKKVICADLIGEQYSAVMVGDGITDLEAAQERVHFIGFGGVFRRPLIQELVKDYIMDPTLLPLLQRLI
ncbi:MAG: HAD-IB family phosphatase [Gammaproteobacteria bacterium]